MNKIQWHRTDIPLFEKWLREKKTLSESSIYVYIHSLRRFLAGNPDIEDLDTYNNFIVKLSIHKRCPHYYCVVKLYIEFKITDSIIKNKLLTGLIKPKIHRDTIRERRYLNDEQIIDVINHMEIYKHRVIALIQKLTGVRAGDVLRTRKDSIMTEDYNGVPTLKLSLLGKGNKRNVVFVHDSIGQSFIDDYRSNCICYKDFCFLQLGNMKGREGDMSSDNKILKMNYQWYWADLKQALSACNIDKKDFATHDFRRCFARDVWSRYKDINVLQSLLNHSNPEVTLKYLEHSGLKNIDYLYEIQMGKK